MPNIAERTQAELAKLKDVIYVAEPLSIDRIFSNQYIPFCPREDIFLCSPRYHEKNVDRLNSLVDALSQLCEEIPHEGVVIARGFYDNSEGVKPTRIDKLQKGMLGILGFYEPSDYRRPTRLRCGRVSIREQIGKIVKSNLSKVVLEDPEVAIVSGVNPGEAFELEEIQEPEKIARVATIQLLPSPECVESQRELIEGNTTLLGLLSYIEHGYEIPYSWLTKNRPLR